MGIHVVSEGVPDKSHPGLGNTRNTRPYYRGRQRRSYTKSLAWKNDTNVVVCDDMNGLVHKRHILECHSMMLAAKCIKLMGLNRGRDKHQHQRNNGG